MRQSRRGRHVVVRRHGSASASSAIRWVDVWRRTGRTAPYPRGGDRRSGRIEGAASAGQGGGDAGHHTRVDGRSALTSPRAGIPAGWCSSTRPGPRMARLRGRSKRGHVAVPRSWTLEDNITAGLRLDGLTAPMLLDGPMNGVAFLAYVEQVLVPTRTG